MRVFAFCDRRYQVATRKVVGPEAEVISSPPIFASDVNPEWFEGAEFFYVDLHGQPGSVYLWSGPREQWAALHVHVVARAKLAGTVVVATTCYLPETPFLQAFLDAGATVIGGGEGNYGTRRRLSGAQVLAKDVLAGLRAGRGTEEAFERAKALLRLNPVRWLTDRKATADALAFKIWRR